MWRLKQLIPKDQAGLEGKTIEVGSLRLQIRSTIAQGGFSSVYLARDAQSGKSYAVKHIICNDPDSLDLVKKEVSALKDMRGHPNIITLHAQSMYDMGRTKECFIVTEYCEKMMVDFLDSRGAGYFEEKQLLLIFRDICNAVYAMHSVSPPIAHRDLKAENLLLGGDGQWKLCDFGSTSTNHRRFETAAEMGVEEDVIRKHTTPAYRAPEMWDLYRREIINEKVDIWALGCLLYRMAYLKSAFDGESKLQILNGNYRIPDLPKYSTVVTGLIKDMLSSSPDSRPDALQVWHRVNNALPLECQKASPDKAPSASSSHENIGNTVQGNKQYSAVPSRAPPPPPQRNVQKASPIPTKEADHVSGPGVSKGGSFWATQYAQDAKYDDDKNSTPKNKSENAGNQSAYSSRSSPSQTRQTTPSPSKESHSVRTDPTKTERSTMKKYYGSGSGDSDSSDTRFVEGSENDYDIHNKKSQTSSVSKSDQAFIEFVADFQKMSDNVVENKGTGPESWNAEMEKLRNELKEARREKMEITSKYEKLTAICRSQRTEIQDLKSALAAANSEPNQASFQKREHQPGTSWSSHNGLNSSTESQNWNAFSDALPSHAYGDRNDSYSTSGNNTFGSGRFDVSSTEVLKKGESSQQLNASGLSGDLWGFHDNFSSLGSGFTTKNPSNQMSQNEIVNNRTSGNNGKDTRQSMQSTPSGWSNF